MDDFTTSSLQESKNEWCARLINILTPLIVEGFQSIFQESWKLCHDNDELDKYLMTFQNLITRVPKWNTAIIDNECKRIMERSGCTYLEDLISCVHVIQLKVLTCIRVGQTQKKVDIDIPKLESFIHNCYIHCARKIYTNVYLYDMNASPLQQQKHKRELEVIVQECVLLAIRDSLPIEHILRTYMDETLEEDVTELVEEEKFDVPVEEKELDLEVEELNKAKKDDGLNLGELEDINTTTNNDPVQEASSTVNVAPPLTAIIPAPTKSEVDTIEQTPLNKPAIRFEPSVSDENMDYDMNAPIHKIQIGNDDAALSDLDIHDVSPKLSIEPDVILDDIELLN